MVERGNKDQHRRTYSGGVKAVETEKWGRSTARERYGKPEFFQGAPSPKDVHAPQKLGDANNLQGPGYANIHRDDWVRGRGESGEGKPNFRRGYHGGK
jgi:hypothetical protein